MLLNNTNSRQIIEGRVINFYPLQSTDNSKAPIQREVESLLDAGDYRGAFNHPHFARCVSPCFSAQCVLDSAALAHKQVVPLLNVNQFNDTPEAIDHAEHLRQRIVNIVRDMLPVKFMSYCNKRSRRNLHMLIAGEWVRLPGFTKAYCEVNNIHVN